MKKKISLWANHNCIAEGEMWTSSSGRTTDHSTHTTHKCTNTHTHFTFSLSLSGALSLSFSLSLSHTHTHTHTQTVTQRERERQRETEQHFLIYCNHNQSL